MLTKDSWTGAWSMVYLRFIASELLSQSCSGASSDGECRARGADYPDSSSHIVSDVMTLMTLISLSPNHNLRLTCIKKSCSHKI